MQVVGFFAGFHSSPKETHVTAVKTIFKYLKGTMEYGLWYPKSQDFMLKAFTNADWEGSVDDPKSSSGATFFLGNCLVSWLSKKKSSISLSMAEAEYISIGSCCTQVIWMKQTLEDLLVKYEHPIIINCDNTSAINMSKKLSHAIQDKTHTNKVSLPKRTSIPEGCQTRVC